jgi:hypothetical protein
MDLVRKFLGWRRGRAVPPALWVAEPTARPRTARPVDASFAPIWYPTIDSSGGTDGHAHGGQTGCDAHGGHTAASLDAGCGGGHHGGH